MKRHLPLAAALVLALASLSFAQEATPSPTPKPKAPRVTKAQLQQQLVELESSMWNAWKSKDAAVFEKNLSADSILVDGNGVSGKSMVAQGIATCNVKSFSLSDWKMTKMGTSTALLTYKAKQDGTCAGQTIPATIWASSIWMKRKGEWVATFHQETPAQ